MRCLYLLPLVALLVPATMHTDPKPFGVPYVPGQPGAGRGFVNPPTVAQLQEEKCLATMIYGEARGEAKRGMQAVAWTAVNRAVNKRICQVVLAPKQYSIFNSNPALQAAATSLTIQPKQKNIIDNAGWNMSVQVAQEVMRKEVPDPTNGATHYLADKVMRLKGYHYPRWSREYKMVVEIDNHKFYKKAAKA